MSRAISADTIAELAKDSFNLATLFRLDFSTPIIITDWPRNLTVGGIEYVSSPHFQEAGSPTESAQLRVNSLNIVFSGVEQSYVSIFLGQSYMGVRARMWKATLDDSDGVIGEPIMVFNGRIVNFGISDTDTDSQVEVELASHWKDFEKVNGRKTNHNSQQAHFPGDMGFEFAAKTVKDIKWGRA